MWSGASNINSPVRKGLCSLAPRVAVFRGMRKRSSALPASPGVWRRVAVRRLPAVNPPCRVLPAWYIIGGKWASGGRGVYWPGETLRMVVTICRRNAERVAAGTRQGRHPPSDSMAMYPPGHGGAGLAVSRALIGVNWCVSSTPSPRTAKPKHVSLVHER